MENSIQFLKLHANTEWKFKKRSCYKNQLENIFTNILPDLL